ncbi:hypothetical protein LAZ67_3004024 [Cordylochernes scorpioides]|uniref:Uncharacterized protein n=1 Tax=Cordylochernes scorpioides TaxID=51811 RepID=A0ABY6K9I9_9ARAC|nr:hypothetical protein LAZ67_3004024 [Cordylochernes scorpioides]
MKAKPKTDYQRGFADWKKRWLKCIAANGDYFEADNLNLTMTFQNGCKIFPLCTKCNSQSATPKHIIDCIDSSIDELYSSPADTIKSLKLYKLDILISLSGDKKREEEVDCLYAKRPMSCIPLIPSYSIARLHWCRGYQFWSQDQWAHVLFSDESSFSLDTVSKSIRLKRT